MPHVSDERAPGPNRTTPVRARAAVALPNMQFDPLVGRRLAYIRRLDGEVAMTMSHLVTALYDLTHEDIERFPRLGECGRTTDIPSARCGCRPKLRQMRCRSRLACDAVRRLHVRLGRRVRRQFGQSDVDEGLRYRLRLRPGQANLLQRVRQPDGAGDERRSVGPPLWCRCSHATTARTAAT